MTQGRELLMYRFGQNFVIHLHWRVYCWPCTLSGQQVQVLGSELKCFIATSSISSGMRFRVVTCHPVRMQQILSHFHRECASELWSELYFFFVLLVGDQLTTLQLGRHLTYASETMVTYSLVDSKCPHLISVDHNCWLKHGSHSMCEELWLGTVTIYSVECG